MNATLKICFSYLAILLTGSLLLSLPWLQKSHVDWIDNIFTATSALSTTGLNTIDIGSHYSWCGQLVILLLIQLGGIGYMTIATMAALSVHHRFSREEHDLIQGDLNLPSRYGFREIVKIKVALTLVVESLGALILYRLFRGQGIENAGWQAVFHSVSAFCTAGFSLFPNNLERFESNYAVQFVVIGLSVIGSLGFIVFSDLYRMFRHKQRTLSITSRIILRVLVIVVVIGTLLMYFTESALQDLSPKDRFLRSFFHTLSASTTVGFSTLSMDSLLPASLFLLCVLMFVGASPTGTGGGLKSTTVAIVFGKMMSTFRHDNKVVLYGNQTPDFRVNLATSSLILYFLMLYLGVFLLLYFEPLPFLSLFFEVSSAIGTVGLSMGITPMLGDAGKLIIIFLMFVGRITPLAFGLMLFDKLPAEKVVSSDDVST